MLEYLSPHSSFQIFGKISEKYDINGNIFAQFNLLVPNESGSLIPAYCHLHVSVKLHLEANLANFAKYLQSGNNICDDYKYHLEVPWLTQFDLLYQGTLFYRGRMV